MPASDLKPEISTEWRSAYVVPGTASTSTSCRQGDEEPDHLATLAPEAGYTTRVRNVGKIQNRGVELTLGLVPVHQGLGGISPTFSKNNNEVKELWVDVTETTIYGLTSGPQLKAIVGESLGTWTFCKTGPCRTSRALITEDDRQRHERLSGRLHHRDGDHRPCDPQIHDGLNNTVRWKDLSLGFSFD